MLIYLISVVLVSDKDDLNSIVCFSEQGLIGSPGPVGMEGYLGPDGIPGLTGLQGLPGKRGQQVLTDTLRTCYTNVTAVE